MKPHETLVLVDGLNMINDPDLLEYLMNSSRSEVPLFSEIYDHCGLQVGIANREEKFKAAECVVLGIAGHVSPLFKFVVVLGDEYGLNQIMPLSDRVTAMYIRGKRLRYRDKKGKEKTKMEADDLLLTFLYRYSKLLGKNVKVLSQDTYKFARTMSEDIFKDKVGIIEVYPGKWAIGGSPARGFFYLYQEM